MGFFGNRYEKALRETDLRLQGDILFVYLQQSHFNPRVVGRTQQCEKG